MPDLTDLIARVEALTKSDNAVDVLVELALFEPTEFCLSCRPNDAGTKLIFTYSDDHETTYLAEDWTLTDEHRAETVRLLKEKLAAILRAKAGA